MQQVCWPLQSPPSSCLRSLVLVTQRFDPSHSYILCGGKATQSLSRPRLICFVICTLLAVSKLQAARFRTLELPSVQNRTVS